MLTQLYSPRCSPFGLILDILGRIIGNSVDLDKKSGMGGRAIGLRTPFSAQIMREGGEATVLLPQPPFPPTNHEDI